jgi:hypothetical protein
VVCSATAHIKRKDCCVLLDALANNIKIGEKSVHDVNPTVLFWNTKGKIKEVPAVQYFAPNVTRLQFKLLVQPQHPYILPLDTSN